METGDGTARGIGGGVSSAADEPAGRDVAGLPWNPEQDIERLLDRPASERAREHRYRFAQGVVFGLPVLGLQGFGQALGGEDSARWVGLMQALLAGWVWYVGAAGMLFEGVLLMGGRRRVSGDGVVALLATALYLISLAIWVSLLLPGVRPLGSMRFDGVVILLALWTGIQSWRWSRRAEGTKGKHAG